MNMSSPEVELQSKLQSYIPDIAGQVLDDTLRVRRDLGGLSLREALGIYSEQMSVATLPATAHCSALRVLTFTPHGSGDTVGGEAMVLWSGFSSNLHDKFTLQSAAVFAANPSRRLIVIPSAYNLWSRPHKLDGVGRKKVREGDLSPDVDPVLQWLADVGITNAVHTGNSFGTARSLAAGLRSDMYGLAACDSILIEPPDVIARSFTQLARDFFRTGEQVKPYIDRAGSPALAEAHAQAGTGIINSLSRMLSLTNLSIARSLTVPRFEPRLMKFLHAGGLAAVSWGSKSELALGAAMTDMMERLAQSANLGSRIVAREIKGAHHAVMEDPYIATALISQALFDLAQKKRELSGGQTPPDYA